MVSQSLPSPENCVIVDGEFIDRLTRHIAKAPESHKYDHGHALILSGGHGATGAARLAARSALRIGTGLVTVASPPEAMAENAAHLTAVMLRSLDGPDTLAEILEDTRLNAVCLGPNLGVGDRTRAFVTAALSARRHTVLDADALTSFADAPSSLFDTLHEDCVLTPHDGEFARLFPDLANYIRKSGIKQATQARIDATRESAVRAGCTVLLKGAYTVIAAPDGTVLVNDARAGRAAPWLATAGSGDVLSGMITGLMARGFDTPEAAATASWMHTEAGRLLGPGLVAEDIPEALPMILQRILRWSPPLVADRT